MTSPSMVAWRICKEINRSIFRDEDFLKEYLIVEVVKGNIPGKRVKIYSKWDKMMEEKWGLKDLVICNIINKQSKRKGVRCREPTPGWLKLNLNGASKGNPSKAGFGAILRDDSGKMIIAIMGLMGIATNNKAEICALNNGLEMCVNKEVSNILIEGNSQVVLNGVMRSNFISWKLNQWLPAIE